MVGGLVLFWMALLAGCGGAPDTTQEAEQQTTPTQEKTTDQTRTLNVLTWEGFVDDSFVSDFEEEHNVEIKATYIGTIDEVAAKLGAGQQQYDLASSTSDINQILVDRELIEPVDVSKLSQYENFYDQFQKPEWLSHDGKQWAVTYDWSPVRFIYNADEIEEPEHSISALWDEQYKGKISMWDDISTLWVTGRLLGYDDVYNLTDEQLNEVKQKLLEQKPLVRKYWSTSGELENLFQSGEVVISTAWSLTTLNLRREGMNIKEFVPKEGQGAWTDIWVIPKGTPNQQLVMEFLDYLLQPGVQAQYAGVTGYTPANKKAAEHMDAEQVQELWMDRPETMFKMDWWKPVNDRSRYVETWNEVKAASQ